MSDRDFRIVVIDMLFAMGDVRSSHMQEQLRCEGCQVDLEEAQRTGLDALGYASYDEFLAAETDATATNAP